MDSNRKLHAAGLLLAGLLTGAAPANATSCSTAALAGLGVANVTVVSAKPSAANPNLCQVFGTVKTTGFGAPDGSAQFELQLPSPWNGKFLFFGVGGLAGSLGPAANPVDVLEAPIKGYATIVTEDRKSTRLNSSHQIISYAVFCLKKKKHAHPLEGQRTATRVSLPRPAQL